MSDLYEGHTPAEVLEKFPALTMTQAAFCLQLLHIRGAKKGLPDRRQFLNLVAKNPSRLRVIDPSLPSAKWRISSEMIRSYVKGDK